MKIILLDFNMQFKLIPDSALLLKNRPFFCPEYVQTLHAKMTLTVKINHLGKYIQEKFANNYYDEIGFALNFYDQQVLKTLIQQGFPWERATCFDGCFAQSEFVKKNEIVLYPTLSLSKNKDEKQIFQTASAWAKIPATIAELSKYMTLRTGDYLAIELDEWKTEPLKINDELNVSANNRNLLKVSIK